MKGSDTQVLPKLEADEPSVIEQRASCKNRSKTSWRTGRLFLTEKRLLFAHDGSFALTIPLEQIRTVRIWGGFSVLVGRRLLELTYGTGGTSAAKRVLLSVNDAPSIAKWLCRVRNSLMKADAVHQSIGGVEESKKGVLQYLAERRYASTAELAGT